MRNFLLIVSQIITLIIYAQKINYGNGSGIVLNNNGYIATNYHVVENATKIEVDVFIKGVKKTVSAVVVKSDKENDLAILKISDLSFKGFGVIPFALKMSVNVGEKTFAMGYPQIDIQGTEVKVTDGIISSKTGFQNSNREYQTSVPIQPGNSGGPLFDNSGNLIGINNAKIPFAENVSYAIKVSYLNNLIDQIGDFPGLPEKNTISQLPLTGKIKALSPFVVLIRVEVPGCDLKPANDAFKQILKTGTSLSAVENIIGAKGDNYRTDNAVTGKTTFYKWTFCNNDQKNIECWYRDGKPILTWKTFNDEVCSDNVDVAHYDQLKPGMTFDQVKSLMGSEGDIYRADNNQFNPPTILVFIRWTNCNNPESTIEVWFNNGKVHFLQKNKLK